MCCSTMLFNKATAEVHPRASRMRSGYLLFLLFSTPFRFTNTLIHPLSHCKFSFTRHHCHCVVTSGGEASTSTMSIILGFRQL
uniref:Putative ovule protein n=1 Tax=Solanum chacoense TaxID=4108 RepID=A0A0V0GM30_SOLCH